MRRQKPRFTSRQPSTSSGLSGYGRIVVASRWIILKVSMLGLHYCCEIIPYLYSYGLKRRNEGSLVAELLMIPFA